MHLGSKVYLGKSILKVNSKLYPEQLLVNFIVDANGSALGYHLPSLVQQNELTFV
jgi:hypothetical protein